MLALYVGQGIGVIGMPMTLMATELIYVISVLIKLKKTKMSKCEICGKEGFHKLSCTNNTARVAIPMTMHSAYIPTLEGEEAEDFIRKADENVKAMRQRRCKNHVWRKHYLNGGKVCQVCGKAKEEQTRNKDVEE